ncbi:MAG: response regulator transcription factor [Firmicutes bacterium]|nr:response regulator transcription factor [Bacillota bacterium]
MLVDDHELFRRGVKSLLAAEPDIEVVGEAHDGGEALTKAQELMPDLILMDISMPEIDGLEATRRVKQAMPYVKILILTVSDLEQNLFEAIKAGAQGYLLKSVDPEHLLDAVRKAYNGEAAISGGLAAKILTEFARRDAQPSHSGRESLGAREMDVLRELSRGASNKEIASVLCISENTVRNHVKNILAKLHLDNRVQAATFAIRQGITSEMAEGHK